MTRTLLIVATVLLFVSVAGAKKHETIEELKARADARTDDHKPLLYVEVLRREIEAANDLFTSGEVEEAHAMVKDVVLYAEKARDAALAHPRKLKATEIRLRKAERRLDDVRHSLALEDQPQVQEAVERFAAIRKEILDVMFAPKEKK